MHLAYFEELYIVSFNDVRMESYAEQPTMGSLHKEFIYIFNIYMS